MIGVETVAGDGVAGILIAAGVLVTACASLVGAWQQRKTHGELRTLNESTLGSLANAAESRRVTLIPYADRTAAEQRHLDQSGPIEPGQGPRAGNVP